MTGDRHRIVTKTFTEEGSEEYVSSVVLSREEAEEQLVGEALLHKEAGWDVRVVFGTSVICARNGKIRVISSRRFTPMEDNDVGTP